MDKLRWGILGVAKIVNRLLPGFKAATNAEIVAIASRDAAKARDFAKANGIPRCHGSYEAVLADPEIDAVYLPLPNTLHANWAKKAADAGKHVLVEKPLAATANEAAEVVAYCRAKNVRLMDGFMWPHQQRTARIREIIAAGTIGGVQHAAGAFTFLLDTSSNNIRWQPGMAGGSLLDVGCYPVYGIRWAMGAEPVSVYATARMRHGVDMSMTGVLHFADGRLAAFDCGFHLPLRQWFEISGTEGTITVTDMWLPDSRARVFLQRGEESVESIDVGGRDQIASMIEEFGHAVEDKRDVRPSPDEAVKTLLVLDALARSAREGKVVDI